MIAAFKKDSTSFYKGLQKTNHTSNSVVTRFQKNFREVISKSCNNKEEDYFSVLNELEQLILCDLLTEEEQNLFMSDFNNKHLIEKSRQLNYLVDSFIERTFSDFILSDSFSTVFTEKVNPLLHPYLDRFIALAQEEVRLAQIEKDEKVLFMGSGR